MISKKRQRDVPALMLASACLLAGGLLAWQIDSAPEPWVAGSEDSSNQASVIAPTLVERPAVASLNSLTATLERPLFHVTRLPAPALPVVQPAPEKKIIVHYRLVGTTIFDGNKVALLEPAHGGRVLRAREGQRIADWQIVTINARSVIMQGAGETVKLRLTIDRGRPKPQRRATVASGSSDAAPKSTAVRQDTSEDDTEAPTPR